MSETHYGCRNTRAASWSEKRWNQSLANNVKIGRLGMFGKVQINLQMGKKNPVLVHFMIW